MYKYFARTRFIGKKVEYLTQCHSTNDEMAKKIRQSSILDGEVIVAGFQTGGKGQRGNVWISEPDKNLLVSIHLKPTFLSFDKIYLINVMAGVAIREALLEIIGNSSLEIKWPNDIYLNDQKLGGILVESILGSKTIENVIFGFGINVNQSFFSLNTATSLFQATGSIYDLPVVLEHILLRLEYWYENIQSEGASSLLFHYHQFMRWRGELHQFEANGHEFEGEIVGINGNGRLVVKQNNRLGTYDVKEIRFVD